MSVFKRPGSEIYSYDFQVGGHRFSGTTGQTGRRKAEAVEVEKRKEAKEEVERRKLDPSGPMTLNSAADRYWIEIGQHHAGSETTWTNLGRLVDHFGKNKRLIDITGRDVAELVAWRRSHTVKGRKSVRDPADRKRSLPAPLISVSTVNRSVIEPLQKIFNRARRVWKISLPNEPDWSLHLLREPRERVREVRAGEERLVEDAVRPDYRALVAFARASGLRLQECLLRKDQVDLISGRISTVGKGRKVITHWITTEMRAILMAEMANPTDFVFTYTAARAKKGPKGWARGERLPVTPSGLKTMWRRSRHKKKGLQLPGDLRFHDMRHDFATKLLRDSGNLKIVQKALHHSKIETTTKYAHVLDEEVGEAMEKASRRRKNRP